MTEWGPKYIEIQLPYIKMYPLLRWTVVFSFSNILFIRKGSVVTTCNWHELYHILVHTLVVNSVHAFVITYMLATF